MGLKVNVGLESTDAAPEVPHPCPMRLPARRSASAFFFFFLDSCRLGSIRADAARFVPNRLRFAPNRADLAKIGPYRPYRVVSAGGRYGRNRPETAETCRKRPKSALNMAGKAETCLLLSFFCESRHSNVFFKNILIVKIYRKLNKNIFNNFLIAESRRTCTHLFQKLSSPAPASESRNAPVLHRALGYTK